MAGHAQRCSSCGQLFVTLAELFNHQQAEAEIEVEQQRRRVDPIRWPPSRRVFAYPGNVARTVLAHHGIEYR